MRNETQLNDGHANVYRARVVGGSYCFTVNVTERGIWQRRYWEHLIRDELDYLSPVGETWILSCQLGGGIAEGRSLSMGASGLLGFTSLIPAYRTPPDSSKAVLHLLLARQ